MLIGAVIGSFVGVLVAGVLQKVCPGQDLVVLQAGLVAAFCLLGVVLDSTDFKKRRKPEFSQQPLASTLCQKIKTHSSP